MNVTLSVGEFATLIFLCGLMSGVLASFGIPFVIRSIANIDLGER